MSDHPPRNRKERRERERAGYPPYKPQPKGLTRMDTTAPEDVVGTPDELASRALLRKLDELADERKRLDQGAYAANTSDSEEKREADLAQQRADRAAAIDELDRQAEDVERELVAALTAAELSGIVRNDTDAYPGAGRIDVAKALGELTRRAAGGVREEKGAVQVVEEAKAELARIRGDVVDLTPHDEPEEVAAMEEALAGEADKPDDTVNLNDVLAANGFTTIRNTIIGATNALNATDLKAFDAIIAYAKSRLAEARVAGAPREHLDTIELDIRTMEAAKRLRRELAKVTEAAKARAVIR